ncbi:MAG: RnfH family protein [Gallionella sp.]|nr:RnfH family protein [Gallionella sp.]MDD4946016.1 RnfH family protein [Gallionella sp.]MDD5613352.1 RnfH family protein [Gallionella sp.]
MSANINVEVVYALPDQQTLLKVSAPAGATVAEVLDLSRIVEKHPELNLATSKLGIFGKLTKSDAVVRDRDRIEIYRPLLADPKEVRRRRAEEGKVMKKGGGDA